MRLTESVGDVCLMAILLFVLSTLSCLYLVFLYSRLHRLIIAIKHFKIRLSTHELCFMRLKCEWFTIANGTWRAKLNRFLPLAEIHIHSGLDTDTISSLSFLDIGLFDVFDTSSSPLPPCQMCFKKRISISNRWLQ